MLERIVGATRERPRAPALRDAARPPRGGARPAARGSPVRRGDRRARHLGDRGAQAPLALGGHDPRGRQRRRDRHGLRARRRRGDLGPHRGAALRRLARGPAGGGGGHRAAGPAQGLHRRPVPALRVGGGRRRRDPADRRGARLRRPLRPPPRGARPRPRRPRRGPRRARARARARHRRRDPRPQQPRPHRLHRRHRAHLRAALRRSRREDGRLGVRLLDPRAARRPRPGRHRRRAGGGDADARRGHRGGLPHARRRRDATSTPTRFSRRSRTSATLVSSCPRVLSRSRWPLP